MTSPNFIKGAQDNLEQSLTHCEWHTWHSQHSSRGLPCNSTPLPFPVRPFQASRLLNHLGLGWTHWTKNVHLSLFLQEREKVRHKSSLTQGESYQIFFSSCFYDFFFFWFLLFLFPFSRRNLYPFYSFWFLGNLSISYLSFRTFPSCSWWKPGGHELLINVNSCSLPKSALG